MKHFIFIGYLACIKKQGWSCFGSSITLKLWLVVFLHMGLHVCRIENFKKTNHIHVLCVTRWVLVFAESPHLAYNLGIYPRLYGSRIDSDDTRSIVVMSLLLYLIEASTVIFELWVILPAWKTHTISWIRYRIRYMYF